MFHRHLEGRSQAELIPAGGLRNRPGSSPRPQLFAPGDLQAAIGLICGVPAPRVAGGFDTVGGILPAE